MSIRHFLRDDDLTAEEQALVLQRARELKAAGEPDERYAAAQLAQLRVRALDRQIAEVKSRLQRLNPVEQSTDYNRLFGDLVLLEKRRRDDLEGTLGNA